MVYRFDEECDRRDAEVEAEKERKRMERETLILDSKMRGRSVVFHAYLDLKKAKILLFFVI